MAPVNPGTPLAPDAVAVVRRALSEPRLAPYLAGADDDIHRAFELYEWNCAVSSTLLRLVEAVEVAVRNGFNDALVDKYGEAWWRPDQPPPILKGKSLEKAENALERWEKGGRILATGKFVSEMSFGFWCALTTGAYDEQWRTALHRAFHGKAPPSRWLRGRLLRLNQVRNRAAHHEIVWTRDLARDRDAATDVLATLHPALLAWTRLRIDTLDEDLAGRPAWARPGTI